MESPTTNVSSLTLSPPDNTSSNLFLTSTLAGRTIFAYALRPLTNSHSAVSLTTPPPPPPPTCHTPDLLRLCGHPWLSGNPLTSGHSLRGLGGRTHRNYARLFCVLQLATSLCTLPTPPITVSTSSQTTCLSLPPSPTARRPCVLAWKRAWTRCSKQSSSRWRSVSYGSACCYF